MSVAVDVADALCEEIRSHYSGQAKVELMLVPKISETELFGGGKIAVVCPRKADFVEESRGLGTLYRITIDVGIQSKCRNDIGEITSLTDFVEDVLVFTKKRKLDGFPAATWIKSSCSPIYDPDLIVQNNVFCSVISTEYVCRVKGA